MLIIELQAELVLVRPPSSRKYEKACRKAL